MIDEQAFEAEQVGDYKKAHELRLVYKGKCEILRKTHGGGLNVLIKAHFKLGKVYLNRQFIKQAVKKFNTAKAYNNEKIK